MEKKEYRGLRLPFRGKIVADLTLLEFVGSGHLSCFVRNEAQIPANGDKCVQKCPGGLAAGRREYVALGDEGWNLKFRFLETYI